MLRWLLLNQWIVLYNVPDKLLTETGPQFVRTFVTKLCVFFVVNYPTTTAYHPQTNRHVEW